MKDLTSAALILVALIQVAIAIAETFFWENPAVYSRIDFPADAVQLAKPIVQNAGLYNSFIAAGLARAVFAKTASFQISFFFLACVAIAGIFGAFTLRPTTLLLQTLPASIALILVWVTHS